MIMLYWLFHTPFFTIKPYFVISYH